MSNVISVTANTVIKTKPVDSNELQSQEKMSLPSGDYLITDYEERGNHLLVTFEQPLIGRRHWYLFKGHVDILKLEPYLENNDKPPENKGIGRVRLPGLDYQVNLSYPILEDGHFTWAEATKNGTRIPIDSLVTQNIFLMAEKMEQVRSLFGNIPIMITSWYRDPSTNRRVGGASKSTHLLGHAVDFNVQGLSPKEVQRRLDGYWSGGLGYGKGFTHLDCRNYKARWNYGS